MDKRLCHVLFDEYPKDSRVRRYTNVLVSRGIEVFVVCSKGIGDPAVEPLNGGGRVYRVPIRKRRSSFVRRMWEYLAFGAIAFLVVSYLFCVRRVRLFHVHTLPDFLAFSCALPKLFGGKIILDFHELFPEFMMQHRPKLNFGSFVIRVLLFLENLSFRFADRIIAFHDPAREILLARINSAKNITVVMNGFDESEISLVERRVGEEFIIVYNGTISFNLNLELVLHAMDKIRTQDPRLFEVMEFRLYGDGPDVPHLLQLAEDLNLENVKYHGRLPFSEMMEELSCVSTCVLPPVRDVYSNLYYSLKLVEMIYLEIPVIATRLDTYQRYYPEGCIAYFSSGDAQALADKIMFVRYHPGEVKIMTRRAREAYQQYSWPIMRERYIELIREILHEV